MFGPPGHLYVYFTYGMHWAANIACGPDGTASRCAAPRGEVVAGMESPSPGGAGARVRDLARGPGRLTQALGIDGSLAGADLIDGDEVTLGPGPRPERYRTGPRVGVSVAADIPWRFWIAGDPFVSAYKRSPRAAPGFRHTRPGIGARIPLIRWSGVQKPG